jgi:hypothetical protein
MFTGGRDPQAPGSLTHDHPKVTNLGGQFSTPGRCQPIRAAPFVLAGRLDQPAIFQSCDGPVERARPQLYSGELLDIPG